MRRIKIFDTTLRDGEQSPGGSLNLREKLLVARQLEALNVDVIEAGFPVTSDDDWEAVRAIGQQIGGPIICALARTVKKDIDAAASALKRAKHPRIHLFCATSKIHLDGKLHMAQGQVLEISRESVRYAKTFFDDIEFSPEDASRTEPKFLARVLEAVIREGATTVNIPDTVGYAMPDQYAELIRYLRENVKGISKAIISAHCHNDLGLAVANSLAAIMAGADQVECTINGLGERAGNASLEEIVMAIRTREDFMSCRTAVNTRKLFATSRLVSTLTGMYVQRNKAVVGENAFAHEAGIHQDGVLKERRTYEIMRPEDVGVAKSQLILGKHSGRHAFRVRAKKLGFKLDEKQLAEAFVRFKALADKKKVVYDEDIEALLSVNGQKEALFTIESVQFTSGTNMIPTATVRLKNAKGQILQDAATGDGPVDAAYRAIERLAGIHVQLDEYSIRSVTKGKDAQGEVTVRVQYKNREITARAVSTDIVQASAQAFLNAINRLLSR